jgi:hypothetical protein
VAPEKIGTKCLKSQSSFLQIARNGIQSRTKLIPPTMAGRAVLSAIPFVGGPASELFAFLIAPTLSRRRDEWFKELADAIEKLGPKCGIWVVIRAQNQLALSKEKSVASCPADACGKEFAFEFRETRVFEVLLSLFERRYFYRSELQASGT